MSPKKTKHAYYLTRLSNQHVCLLQTSVPSQTRMVDPLEAVPVDVFTDKSEKTPPAIFPPITTTKNTTKLPLKILKHHD